MTNLNLFNVFLCVADEKNISRASQKLYVSQPAISTAIKELEKSLNCQLFIRKNKGVDLTPMGEKLYQKCKYSVLNLQSLDEYFLNLRKDKTCIIKIGVNTSNLNQLFYDAITTLLKTYTSVEISIQRHTTEELYNMLEQGKLNYIAIDSEMFKNGLKTIVEFNIEYEVIGDKNYYLKFKDDPLKMTDINNESFILANKSYTSRKNIDDFFDKNQITLMPKFELDGYGYVKEFVLNGYGLSIVNPYYFEKEINEGKIFVINKNFNFPKRKIILATTKSKTSNKILNEFEQIVSELVNLQ